jgi:hypothetical protein
VGAGRSQDSKLDLSAFNAGNLFGQFTFLVRGV